jgi:NADH-quinone oxidoreductase subunit N
MKYFLLGAFATGFLLYGIALIYGATGSFSLDQIAAALPTDPGPDPPDRGRRDADRRLRLQGRGGAVPHVDADVYEGAPTTVTALMAVAVKAPASRPSRDLPARLAGSTPTGRCCSGSSPRSP